MAIINMDFTENITPQVVTEGGYWSVLRKDTETSVLAGLRFDLAIKAAAALSNLGIACIVRNGGR
jgi:hypothetical protein